MIPLFDIHTHALPPAPGRIVSLDRPQWDRVGLYPEQPFSVGIHPWSSAQRYGAEDFELLRRLLMRDNVVALGEVGLDGKRGAPLDVQIPLLERQLRMAQQIGKPAVLHIVGAWQQIIEIKQRMGLNIPLTIHGFRSKPQLAKQLLEHGFSLSFGARYNQAAFDATPPERRFRESDENLNFAL